MQPLQTLPKHLEPYIATQDFSMYSAIDHAGWRYIMSLSKDFFAEHAHRVYLDGLKKTGIHTDRIPRISEMDERLQKFGWRAVPIVGFIPPAVFMEFLSLGILPIACDIRNLEHLEYTPAPDIVHEAAGHAPMLADPAFAKYLLGYGEIARKVIYTDRDEKLYQAIRELSDTKESPKASAEDIESAQKRMEEAYANLNEVSEATALARMGWWTFEYGLIGDLENPKIYGAGLLSSVSEGYNCLRRDVAEPVKFVPFSMDCIEQAYDITKPQPQLFVTPDFETLEIELQKLGDKMAFRRGGIESLEKAKRAKTVTTTELDSGVQIGGVLSDILCGPSQELLYLKFTGPCQLAYEEKELEGQGPENHAEGFGAPIGLVSTLRKSLGECSAEELASIGVRVGKSSRIEFVNGVIVEGKCVSETVRNGKRLILTFDQCTVRYGEKILFDPSWGKFDLACGARVVSVFGGAPDRGGFLLKTEGEKRSEPRQTSNLQGQNAELVDLYSKIREIRESLNAAAVDKDTAISLLGKVTETLRVAFPSDWLLRFEILELDVRFALKAPWMKQILGELAKISKESKAKAELITRGLMILKNAKVENT